MEGGFGRPLSSRYDLPIGWGLASVRPAAPGARTMINEHEGDRLMARVLGRDLQGATMRLGIYGLVISAVAATVLFILT